MRVLCRRSGGRNVTQHREAVVAAGTIMPGKRRICLMQGFGWATKWAIALLISVGVLVVIIVNGNGGGPGVSRGGLGAVMASVTRPRAGMSTTAYVSVGGIARRRLLGKEVVYIIGEFTSEVFNSARK